MDENVQYLCISQFYTIKGFLLMFKVLAIMWFVSRPIAVSLIPYTIFSLFHFLTYFRSNILPTLNPNALKSDEKSLEASVCRHIQHLVKIYYESAMKLVSKVEVILIGTRVLIGAFA